MPPPTSTSSEPVLCVERLRKSFAADKGSSVEALKGISFELDHRQVTGLVGPDGAGKTTLLRIASGLMTPTEGSVHVLGLDATRDSVAVQQRLSYMPQKFGLYQDLTVQENLDLYADLQGVDPAQRSARYDRLMQMTGLDRFRSRLAGKLSGGMKQKLGLACALVKSPEVLLLDEPTVGVDPVSRRELWQIVYDMVHTEGIGVLVATAYLDEAEQCGHVVMLHEGQILAASEPKAFAERLRGHVFSVSPAAGVRPRTIQGQLIGQPGIVDATIRNGRVRTVTADPDATPIRMAATTTLDGIRPTTPSFEDAFIKALADLQRPAPSRENAGSDISRAAARSQADVVVQARDLTKRFGDFVAVSGVTFEVTRGEIFGLLGPNGAGKSTTFRMLCGLSKVSAGEVSVAGHDLRRSGGTARQQLGYMAQQFSLYANLTVRENLRFYGRAYGLSADRLKHRMSWALSEFELAERSDEAAGALPGGYKQRLAMAASLLHEPQILFLDEPTSGVDPIARRDFWRRINAFAEAGVTVIVTTHFMEEAEYCDRMLIMSQGKTLAMGTPAEIRAMARTETQPDPTIEDAFIALAEGHVRPGQGSAS